MQYVVVIKKQTIIMEHLFRTYRVVWLSQKLNLK